MRVNGRWFDASLLERIKDVMRHQPGISRNALAAKVCSWTGWYNALGQPQVSSARYALARLDRSGVIQLPALPPAPAPGSRPGAGARPAPPMAALAQVEGKLATLGPIELLVADSAASRAVYSQLMQHHPLGDLRLCAAQMRYLFRSAQGWLGACAFQSGNFALQARDRWIGWNENVRRGNLPRLVCNTRFLILPSVRVPHLASHLLGRLARELPVHWHARYGVRPLLLETFVHPQHAGTCYKAAGWSCVGHSAGRRDGVAKAVWVRELGAGAREALRCGPERLPRERPDHPEHWAEVEFGALEIWDARLKKRAFDLADEFLGHAQARRVARRHAERAKAVAAIRFFRNPRISMRTLLAAHREAVVERMRAHPLVLVPQDESSLIFAAHPGSEGLGPVGTRLAGGPIGLMLHDSLAFTPQGVPLGVVWAECRAGDAAGPSQQRPADERSSRQGLEAYRVLRDIAPRVPDTCLVSIADREADLSGLGELFALARDPKSPRLLVRVCQGRQHQAGTEAGRPPPWAQIRALPVAGRTSLDVPRRGLQEGRKAQLALRFGTFAIEAPKGSAGAPIELWAIGLDEEEPPEGAQAVQWMLLTNVATTSLDEALERVRWYGARSGTEVFHRTLQIGCGLEDRQLGYPVRLENCLAIDLVVAWRIHYMAMPFLLRRTKVEVPADGLLADQDGTAPLAAADLIELMRGDA